MNGSVYEAKFYNDRLRFDCDKCISLEHC